MNEREFLLTSILKCDRTELYANPPVLTPEQERQLADYEERLRQHEPLQYIIGECEFMGCRFKVDPHVLIPRPETELLVEHLIQFIAQHHHSDQIRILDIGTGSGNIAITIAHQISDARVWGLDVSLEAIQLARLNARLNHVSPRVDFIHMDLRDFAKNYTEAEKRFDIIVSNPPYIKTSAMKDLPENVKREPHLALDGGEDGLSFYRLIIGHMKRFLRDDGVLACEIGDGQKEDISELLKQQAFHRFHFVNDYMGVARHFIAQG